MRTIKIELQCSYFVQQRHLAARRISQHPAGKSCRVFALTPAARFPLASRTLPHKVSSLRFAPLRYFAGAPFERLQSVGVRILSVLPTLAGALRAFRARRISQHPAGKSCRVFALTPAARFPLASRPPPYRVLCIVPFFVLPTLAGALRAFRARRISQHPAGKSCRVFASTPAAFAPQSFLSPHCSVAVLYGDPVYGFRSRHAHYPTKFPRSALLRCGTLRGPRLNVFNRWALGYSSCSVTRGTASTV